MTTFYINLAWTGWAFVAAVAAVCVARYLLRRV